MASPASTVTTQKPIEKQIQTPAWEYNEKRFEQELALDSDQSGRPEEAIKTRTLASYRLVTNEDGSRSYEVVTTQSAIEISSVTAPEEPAVDSAFKRFITEAAPKIDLGGTTVKAMESGARITTEAVKEAFDLAKYILHGPSSEQKPKTQTPEEEQKKLEQQARERQFIQELPKAPTLEDKIVEVGEKPVRIEDLTKTISLQESYTGVVDSRGRVNVSHKAAFEKKEAENLARAIQAERDKKMAEVKKATLSSERFNLDEAAEGGGGLSGMTRGPGQ